jgi:hypothetical protein
MQLCEFVHVRGELLVQLGHLLRTPVRANSSTRFSAFPGLSCSILGICKKERETSCEKHVTLLVCQQVALIIRPPKFDYYVNLSQFN